MLCQSDMVQPAFSAGRIALDALRFKSHQNSQHTLNVALLILRTKEYLFPACWIGIPLAFSRGMTLPAAYDLSIAGLRGPLIRKSPGGEVLFFFSSLISARTNHGKNQELSPVALLVRFGTISEALICKVQHRLKMFMFPLLVFSGHVLRDFETDYRRIPTPSTSWCMERRHGICLPMSRLFAWLSKER